jgi:hypothetical protein
MQNDQYGAIERAGEAVERLKLLGELLRPTGDLSESTREQLGMWLMDVSEVLMEGLQALCYDAGRSRAGGEP